MNQIWSKAKADFKEFLETGEFDTADETIKTLMEKFKEEFAG
jgi:predicted transcriptional regulator